MEAVISENISPNYDLRTYFTRNISYVLSGNKMKGLEKFLGFIQMQ